MSRKRQHTEQCSVQLDGNGQTAKKTASPEKHRRLRLLLLAALILIIALIWRVLLEKNGIEGQLARDLQAHGYTVVSDDLYPAGAYSNASIRSLLPDVALDDAIAASGAAGFPSDVDRQGQIILYMALLENGDVITLFVVDRRVELGFIQTPNSDGVYPLWEE